MRIFLSHSHQDNNWCSAFVEELKRYGADVWYDKQGLYVGAKWRQTIETELEGRDIFLLVLTPNSWASDWVQDELTLAMNHKKRIVGILHQPTEIKGFITTRQMLKAIGLSSVEAAKSVAASLGLAREEQAVAPISPAKLSASKEVQSVDEEYDYFEITMIGAFLGFSFLITNMSNAQVFYKVPFLSERFTTTRDTSKGNQKSVEELREVARIKGLEELPEKGAEWYSYRFRRKKQ